MQGQRAQVAWADGGVPVSSRFDDPYFSLSGGLAETRHVFLQGNGLPERLCDGFHVAELGFGTGLTLAVLLSAWRGAGIAGQLNVTSFEAFPMAPEDQRRALGAFPGIADAVDDLLAAMAKDPVHVRLPELSFRMIIGDARETLPAWDGSADAWFLDGFAPARNPELWEPELLVEVGRHTAPGGTFATYTAAGHVRRALDAAGFEVVRRTGFGRKRHMSTGRLR